MGIWRKRKKRKESGEQWGTTFPAGKGFFSFISVDCVYLFKLFSFHILSCPLSSSFRLTSNILRCTEINALRTRAPLEPTQRG